MNDLLFVYGSLAPEHAPPEIAGAARRLLFVSDGFVRGKLYDFGDFRGAKLRGEERIDGRVYRMPAETGYIETLDAYENFDPARPDESLFVRAETVVTLVSGEQTQAWIYAYNGSTSDS